MSFSDDAIGFFLQAEDQLSPVLSSALGNYKKYTTGIEALNKTAYKSISKVTGSLAALTEEITDLPREVNTAYKKVLAGVNNKAITQRVKVKLETEGKDAIAKSVGDSVRKALGSMTLRLSPTYPSSKSPLFNTVGLKSAYSKMTQPPDMTGSAKVPKFAAGGIVEGPGGIDKVLAYLTAGEMVVPKDATQEILGNYTKSLRDKGRFTPEQVAFSRQVGPLVGEIRALVDAVSTAQGAGMTTETAGAALEAQTLATDKLKALSEALASMPLALQKDMAPVLEETTKAVDGLAVAAQEAAKIVGKAADPMADLAAGSQQAADALDNVAGSSARATGLLERMMGPVRYLAFAEAYKQITDGAAETSLALRGSMGDASGQVMGFIEALNKTNITLDLTRSGLARLKSDVADLGVRGTNLFLVNMTELGDAVRAMTDAGFRANKQFTTLAPTIARISNVTGVSVDNVSKSTFRMSGLFRMTDNQVTATFLNMRRYAQQGKVSIEELNAAMESNTADAELFLATLSPDIAESTITGLSRATAALTANFGASGAEISSAFSKALGGDIEAIQQLSKGGVNVAALTTSIQAGDVTALDNAMKGYVTRLQEIGMASAKSGNTLGLTNIAETLGVSKSLFGVVIRSGEDIVRTFDSLNDVTIDADGAMRDLARAGANTTTLFEKLKNAASNVFARFGGNYVLDFFKEFNPLAALGVITIVRFGVETALAVGKASAAMLSALPGIGKYFMAFTTGQAAAATTAVTANTAAVATLGNTAGRAGFVASIAALGPALASLSAGLALLGTKGLPGIVAIGGLAGALTGMGIALAYSTKWLVPFVDVLGTKLTDVIYGLGAADPAKLAVLAASLTTLGVAFAPMAASVALGLTTLTAATLAYRVAMGALGSVGVDISLGSTLSALTQFATLTPEESQRIVNRTGATTRAVSAVSDSMFALSRASLAAMTATVTGAVMRGLDALAGGASGLDKHKQTIQRMFKTALDLGNWARGFKTEEASAGFKTLAGIVSGYGEMAGTVSRLTTGALTAKAAEYISMLFTDQSPLQHIVQQSGNIKRLVPLLIDTFKGFRLNEGEIEAYTQNVDKVSQVLAPMAGLFDTFAGMSSAVNQLREGVIFSGTFERIRELMESMNDPRNGLGALLRETNFAALGWTRGVGADLIGNIDTTSRSVDALSGFLEKLRGLGTEARSTSGYMGDLSGDRLSRIVAGINGAGLMLRESLAVSLNAVDLPTAERINELTAAISIVESATAKIVQELRESNETLHLILLRLLQDKPGPAPQVNPGPGAPRPSNITEELARGGLV